MTELSIIVENVVPGKRGFTKAIKISCDEWELNIWLTESDIANLKAMRPGRWADRKALQIGTMARAPVFWSMEERKLTILVGEDDETWDAAFTLPDTALKGVMQDL